MMRGLLVIERQRKQRRLGKWTADQFNAHRKSAGGETGRDRNRRESGVGRERRIAARLRATNHRRNTADRRIHDRVEPVGIHHRGEGLAERVAGREPGFVVLAREVVVGNGTGNVENALKRRGVQSGLEQIVNRRRVRADVLEIVPEVELQLLSEEVRCGDELCKIRHLDIDCGGALCLHLLDRAANDSCHLAVLRCGAEELGEDADARVLQRAGLERRHIRARYASTARCGRWIRGVVANGRVQDQRDVLDRSRHRATGVLGVAERNDASTARQTQ